MCNFALLMVVSLIAAMSRVLNCKQIHIRPQQGMWHAGTVMSYHHEPQPRQHEALNLPNDCFAVYLHTQNELVMVTLDGVCRILRTRGACVEYIQIFRAKDSI